MYLYSPGKEYTQISDDIYQLLSKSRKMPSQTEKVARGADLLIDTIMDVMIVQLIDTVK